jgi:hypothetical protein
LMANTIASSIYHLPAIQFPHGTSAFSRMWKEGAEERSTRETIRAICHSIKMSEAVGRKTISDGDFSLYEGLM